MDLFLSICSPRCLDPPTQVQQCKEGWRFQFKSSADFSRIGKWVSKEDPDVVFPSQTVLEEPELSQIGAWTFTCPSALECWGWFLHSPQEIAVTQPWGLRTPGQQEQEYGVEGVKTGDTGHKPAVNQFPSSLQYKELGFSGAAEGEIGPT